MKKILLLNTLLVFISTFSIAQGNWKLCHTPTTIRRVDDIFMTDTRIGYAVNGDGLIMKTTDGGHNWISLNKDTSIYCRSVEFVSAQKGFVGAFPNYSATANILRMTTDGGLSWIDKSPLLDARARKGICGLCAADSNTIYGCGNWYQDSAYIVKSIDGGASWSFMDMHAYASHLIDMYFINKDTGFATGSSVLPAQTAIILYTADGGNTWSTKFQNNINSEYCWKIQHLTNQIYFASIQDDWSNKLQIIKSANGGMSWVVDSISIMKVSSDEIQGVGFIDSLKGWTGGGNTSFESNDGGKTWDTISICPFMNRLFRVNDTLLFTTGNDIWKYTSLPTGIATIQKEAVQYSTINCYPNPVINYLSIDVTSNTSTQATIILLNNEGKRIKLLENAYKSKGNYQYQMDMQKLATGIYYVVLKTHDDDKVVKILVRH